MTALAVHGSLWSIGSIPDSRPLWGDEKMYWLGAGQLHAGEDWHPPPLWPSLYPHFMAWILAAGGSTAAVRGIQTLMLVAIALIWRDLTRRLTGSRLAGDVAGALTLIYPPLASFAHLLWPEVLHLLLFSSAVWILIRRSDRWAWLLSAGALLGLCLLTKSLVGPFLPLLLLPLVARADGTVKARVVKGALVVLALCAVIAPTVASNHRRATGVMIANSSAFNLWVGLNDRSRKTFVDPVAFPVWRDYYANGDTFPERNAYLWRRVRAFVKERGILPILSSQLGRQYFRLLDKDSCLTDMLPGGAIVARGGGYRQPPAAIASGLRITSYFLYAGVLVATVVGVALCPPRGRRWLTILLLFLAYNLTLFLVLHAKSRFRVPFLPVLFLYSGCAVAWVAHRVGLNPEEAELWSPETSSRSWVAASTAATLLLFLAFGGHLGN